MGVFHSPILAHCTVFQNAALEQAKGIFQHSYTVLNGVLFLSISKRNLVFVVKAVVFTVLAKREERMTLILRQSWKLSLIELKHSKRNSNILFEIFTTKSKKNALWKVENTGKQALTLSQTTHFRLFQTQRKQGGERRNCLFRAISPFPSVFKRLVQQTYKNQGLFGTGLISIYLQLFSFSHSVFNNLLPSLYLKQKST